MVLYQISLDEDVITSIRTDCPYGIVMKPIICNTHIMSSSMRIQSVFDIVVILVTINCDAVCSSGIKCKPHIMKLTTSYLQVMRWSISKKVESSSSKILISQICNL